MKTSPAPANSTGGPSPPPQAHPVQTLPPFLSKCYDMVDDPSTDGTVSWSAGGDSFVVWDPHSFSRDLLPKYFKHNNLSSFVRQLNTYGFHKVDPDRWEFANNGFLRGQKHLLKTIISRKKTTQNVVQPKPSLGKTTPVKACVEVGKFGLEEEMERLKRDKNVLMQELVKLRQHQQLSDSEVCSLKQRLKVMELQQQQMLSFLAMAMQSPGFLAQFLQQNGNNRWRAEPNKKRRLPALEEGEYAEEAVSDVQIVRYQPAVTENSEPLPEQVLNTEVTHEPNSLSVGVNGMFMNDATLYGADSDGQIVRYHPTVTEISDPLPERVLNTEVTHEPDSLSVGVNDMFMNDVTLYGEDSSFQAEEEFLFDIPDDLTQLLDNLLSENNIETETYDMENSVIGKDNELPQYKIEFGTPQNLVLTDEQMVAENTVTQMDNKIV